MNTSTKKASRSLHKKHRKSFYFSKIALPAILLCMLNISYAQDLQDYTFRTGVDASKWVTLTDNATEIFGSSRDDAASSVMNIGFNFAFGEGTYSQFSVNTNGAMRLGSVAMGSSYSYGQFGTYANQYTPKISGCADDIGTCTGGYIKYEVFGTAPARTLVVEYKMGYNWNSYIIADVMWQVQLHEDSNKVVLVYGSTVPDTTPSGYQTGLSTSESDFCIINPTTNAVAFYTSQHSTTYTGWHGASRYYEFVRAYPSCPKPVYLEVENLATTSTTISWTELGTASQWMVEYGAAGFQLGTGTSVVVNDTIFSMTNLTANTEYDFYVKSICGTDDYSRWTKTTFRTECEAITTLPWVADLESNNWNNVENYAKHPFCWELINGGSTSQNWGNTTSTSYIKTGTAAIHYFGSTSATTQHSDWLITPELPLTGNEQLSFWMRNYTSSTGSNYTARVAVYAYTVDPTDGGLDTSNFVQLGSRIEMPGGATEYTEYIVPLTGLTGNVRLAFVVDTQSYSFYIDDVVVETPSCKIPTELCANVTSPTSVTITWNLQDSNNNFVYVMDTLNAMRVYNAGATQIMDTSITFTNLYPNKKYRFYLQNVCDGGDTSGWIFVDFNTTYGVLRPVQNTEIANADYAMTLSNTTTLYFDYSYVNYNNSYVFIGAESTDSAIVVPSTGILENGNIVTFSRCGSSNYRMNFSNAPNVKSLTLPSTITNIYVYGSFPSTIKELHLNSYPTINNSNLSSLDIVYVPAELLEQFYSDEYWHRKVLILAEGTQPFSATINVNNPGEFAQLVLAATNNDWNKINELTVTGALSANDLNNFKNLKMLTKLDLSQAQITSIPDNFCYYDDYYYYSSFALLKKLKLPELESIGYHAFKYTYKLDSVVLLDGIHSIGGSAFFNSGIKYINLPEGLTNIGSSAFYNTNLTNVVLPSTISSVPQNCFYSCNSLRFVTIPENIETIEYSAFAYTALDSIDLPGVKYINSNAFAYCTRLSKINFSDSLFTIEYYAFDNCTALTEVDLPSNVSTVLYDSFHDCSNIRKFTCRTVTPPYTETSSTYKIIGGCDMTNVQLFVPAMSIANYRVSGAWQSFYTILPIEDKLTYLNITEDIVIDSAVTIDTSATVYLNILYDDYYHDIIRNGSLNFRGEDTLNVNLYKQRHDERSYNINNSQQPKTGTSLISDGIIKADSVCTEVKVSQNTYWYFISFPYDVRASEIGYTPGCQFVIRKYSGLNRAQQTGNTWQNITIDSVLHAYEGYILKCSMRNATFTFPAMDGGVNKLFEKNDAIVPVHEYISEFDHNRSWNLIGNPYPCYYDTRRMEFTAPITVWNRDNNRYDAYSPVDDDYILYPMEAFFVQAPIDQEAITFNKEGRQTNNTVQDVEISDSTINYAMKMQDRKLFNISISDGKDEDRTRIVLNESAFCGYELDKDATKLIDAGSEAMLIYTLVDTLKYAINERPLDDETVSLGFYAPHKGEYTISLDTKENERVLLIDHEKCIQADLTMGFYSFSAEKGYTDKRFSVLFGKDGNVGIEDIENTNIQFKVNRNQLTVTADYTVYSIDGKHIATAKADETVTLKTGVYLVVSKNVTRKIVIAL